jgi:hypothetical protein
MLNFHKILLSIVLIAQWAYGSKVGFYANYLILGAAGFLLFFQFGFDANWPAVASVLMLFLMVSHCIFFESQIDGQFVNLALWIFLVPLVKRLIKYCPAGDLGRMQARSLCAGTIILSADFVVRIVNPGVTDGVLKGIDEGGVSWFYKYKFGGFMFSETNTFGLCALSIYISARILKTEAISKYISVASLALIFSSFSRSALACVFLYEISNKFKNLRIRLGFLRFLSYCILLNVFAYMLPSISEDLVALDGSGESKVKLVQIGMDSLLHFDQSEAIFGKGLGASVNYLGGDYFHNIYVIILFEMGLLGAGLFLWNFWLALDCAQGGLILIVYSTIALSYFFMLGSPAMFLPVLISLHINQDHNKYIVATAARR